MNIKTVIVILLATAAVLISAESEYGSATRADLNGISTSGGQKNEDRYDVALTSLGHGKWGGIRVDTRNGKSWKLGNGRWTRILESRQARPAKGGTFRVQVVSTSPGRFGALRLNEQTGESWELNEDLWQPVLDPVD